MNKGDKPIALRYFAVKTNTVCSYLIGDIWKQAGQLFHTKYIPDFYNRLAKCTEETIYNVSNNWCGHFVSPVLHTKSNVLKGQKVCFLEVTATIISDRYLLLFRSGAHQRKVWIKFKNSQLFPFAKIDFACKPSKLNSKRLFTIIF